MPGVRRRTIAVAAAALLSLAATPSGARAAPEETPLPVSEIAARVRTDQVLVQQVAGGGDTEAARRRLRSAVAGSDVVVVLVARPPELTAPQIHRLSEALADRLVQAVPDRPLVVGVVSGEPYRGVDVEGRHPSGTEKYFSLSQTTLGPAIARDLREPSAILVADLMARELAGRPEPTDIAEYRDQPWAWQPVTAGAVRRQRQDSAERAGAAAGATAGLLLVLALAVRTRPLREQVPRTQPVPVPPQSIPTSPAPPTPPPVPPSTGAWPTPVASTSERAQNAAEVLRGVEARARYAVLLGAERERVDRLLELSAALLGLDDDDARLAALVCARLAESALGAALRSGEPPRPCLLDPSHPMTTRRHPLPQIADPVPLCDGCALDPVPPLALAGGDEPYPTTDTVWARTRFGALSDDFPADLERWWGER